MAPNGSTELPTLTRFGFIAASSAVAESVTFPIDFAKTRMQLTVGRRGFFEALFGCVRQEGLSAVYAALPAAVLRHWVYSTLRISLYEDLRNLAAGGYGGSSTTMKIAASLVAGGTAQFCASPTDRVKVLVVQNGGRESVFRVAAGIARVEGFAGFYRGVLPNVTRASLVNIGELATYDTAKRFVLDKFELDDGVVAHTLSAFCSGFVASLCSTPADVVKSRVMGGKMSSWECVKTTMVREGPLAFYKGFIPNWTRLGPWQLCFWVSYEQLRQVAGYSGDRKSVV